VTQTMKSACTTCSHVKEDGTCCQSPARRWMRYCYSHQRDQVRRARMQAERSRQRWFESVALADPHAIQVAIAKIMQRLIAGEIGHEKAGQLLYTLQNAIASLNSGNHELAKQDTHLRPRISRDFLAGSSSKMVPQDVRGGHSCPPGQMEYKWNRRH
jgi:hypothetical protein